MMSLNEDLDSLYEYSKEKVEYVMKMNLQHLQMYITNKEIQKLVDPFVLCCVEHIF